MKTNDEVIAAFGMNVRRARRANGLTQKELANMLNCVVRVVLSIEKGELKRLPPIERIYRLSKVLDTDMVDLVPGLENLLSRKKDQHDTIMSHETEWLTFQTSDINSAKVKETRKKVNRTQKQLAEIIVCGKRLLQAIENNKMKQYPPMEVAISISEQLGIPIDNLLPNVPFRTKHIWSDIKALNVKSKMDIFDLIGEDPMGLIEQSDMVFDELDSSFFFGEEFRQ